MAPISTELAAEPSRAETQKLSAARHDVIDAAAHAWQRGVAGSPSRRDSRLAAWQQPSTPARPTHAMLPAH